MNKDVVPELPDAYQASKASAMGQYDGHPSSLRGRTEKKDRIQGKAAF